MPAHSFTTELLSEEIQLGLYDPTGIFTVPVTHAAGRQGLTVVLLAAGAQFDDLQAQTCYKIVVAISPCRITQQVLDDLAKLSEYQEKVVVWLPVISSWQEEVSGEIPLAAAVFSLQEKVIDVVNSRLSQAVLVLGQDIVLPPGSGGVFDLLLQKVVKNIAFVPSFQLFPVGLAEFVVRALAVSIRPDRVSTLIKGKPQQGRVLVEQIVHPYEQYYFHQVGLQPIAGVLLPVIDFPLQEEVVVTSIEAALKWYSRQLPSPTNWKVLMPPVNTTAAVFSSSSTSSDSFYSTVSYPQFENPEEVVDISTAPQPEPIREDRAEARVTEKRVVTALQPEPEREVPKQVLQEEFDLQDEIQRIFGKTRSEEKIIRVEALIKNESKITKTSKKRTAAFYSGLAFTGAGLGVLFLVFVFLLSTALLRKQVVATIQAVTQKSDVSVSHWKQLQSTTHFVSAQAIGYEKVVSLPQIDDAKRLSELSTLLQSAVTAETAIIDTQESGFRHVMGTESEKRENSQNILTQLLTAQESLETALSLIEQNTAGAADELFSLTVLQEKAVTLQRDVSIFQSLAPLWQDISGQSRTRNYAVVLQNNQELRPTGGMVESFAVLTFERGSLTNFRVFSSYELKGTTPGQVIPPEVVTRYLGEKNLNLYDANWSPDFVVASKQMSFFMEHAANVKLDGVISLDMYGVQRIISVLGPLELPEFNEVITAENVFERLEAHPEVVLVNDEKNKDYRVVLFTHLLSALRSANPDKSAHLLRALQSNFADQSMQWQSLYEDETAALQNLGWTGTVLYPKCPSEFSRGTCLLDSVYMVEANVGINKANYYLERSISDQVTVAADHVTHQFAATFNNTSKTQSWPKGTYKNYLRFYIPQQAYSTRILIDGVQVPAPQLDVATEFERQVIGTLVEVPIQTTVQVQLEYTLPYQAGTEKLNYAYLRQRQPGSGQTAATVSLQFAPELSPTVITPQASVEGNFIKFSDTEHKTNLFGVQFTR